MLAAITPAVAKGFCKDELGEEGAAPCLQWSATCVTLVTLNTCPAPALVLVPVPGTPALAFPEPETPAWPTLPVPAPVEALALAAD
jgi:hypothetical protein